MPAAPLLFAGLAVAITVALLAALGWWRASARTPAPAAPDLTAITAEARRALIEPLPTPVLLLADNRIAEANAAARAALGEDLAGKDARVAFADPDVLRLLGAGDGESVTIAGLTGPGSLWQLTRRRIDPQTWLILFADRTAEAQVSRAHTDFVANASHELRTPLASIIGYVETLEDGGPTLDAATARRFHGIVLREARRMLTLVGDLMTLSQVEAEKHSTPQAPIDLAQLASRVVGEVSSLKGKERVGLGELATGEVIHGEAQQLEQVLRNLIDNALKYGDPATPVTVSVCSSAQGPVLAVQDRGAGIAPEHIPLLTRRFYRTDPGRSRASGGTGLGLAIVKHIVERHRARLEFASELGVGTTVSVIFPGSAPAAAAELS